jgi:hypothetical protein
LLLGEFESERVAGLFIGKSQAGVESKIAIRVFMEQRLLVIGMVFLARPCGFIGLA